MKKRLLAVMTTLCLLLSMTVLPIAAQGTGLAMLHIQDTSLNYSAFTQRDGLVYDLDDSTDQEQVFQYSVPTDGVSVVIFFRANGCTNSDRLIDEVTDTQWGQSELVNIIAVESRGSDKATVEAYMAEHDPRGVIDKVYYNPNSNSTAFWYAKLVDQDGDMSGVTNWGDSSFSAAYVLLITENAGTKYIEFSIPGVDTASYLTSYINEIIETSDPSFEDKIVDVTVSGNMRYDYAQDVFELVNEERSSQGAGTLTFSGQLTALAMQRAAELAVYYDHTRPNREGPFSVNGEVINGVTVSYDGLKSENIALGQRSPAMVMNSWMSSTMGHRENILNVSHTQIGVGCFESNGYLYWVQLFGA